MHVTFSPDGQTTEGKQHPDRNAQFEHIAARVKAFQRTGQPVISIDTKKKESLGNMKNPGKTYRRKGEPTKVKTHDFSDKKLGKAIPYGIYDLTYNCRQRQKLDLKSMRGWMNRNTRNQKK